MTASSAASAAYSALPPAASGAITVATSSDTVPSGPDHDPRRGPEDRVRQHRQQQGVQPGADRDPGQLGVGHRRRQGQRRDRDTGDDIGAQRAPEYVENDRANGTYRVVSGGRLADANAPRPLYALLNGCTVTPNRTAR